MRLPDLRAHIDSLGIPHKTVAGNVVDWIDANAPDSKVTLSTAVSKLSKLLALDEEGIAFWDSAIRREALAIAISLPRATLDAAFDVREILVDPCIPKEVFEALKRQAARGSVTVEFVDVKGAGRVAYDGVSGYTPEYGPLRVSEHGVDRTILRDASDEHPRGIVVLGSSADEEWFSNRKRASALLTFVGRGYELSQNPTWLPVPPPTPAMTWTRDGTPLLPSAELTAVLQIEAGARKQKLNARSGPHHYFQAQERAGARISAHRYESLVPHLLNADERGEEPAYPLVDVLGWLGATSDARAAIRDIQFTPPKRLLAPGADDATTHLWWTQTRLVLAVGPQAHALVEMLRPHHEVQAPPPALLAWQHALAHRNLFDPAVSKPLLEQLREVCLDLEASHAEWKRTVAGHDGLRDRERVEGRSAAVEVSPMGSERIADARATLLALASRPMKLPSKHASLPFRLDAAARGPLLAVRPGPRDVLAVLANLGGGRILRIRLAQFEGKGEGLLVGSCAVPATQRYYGPPDSEDMLFELDGDGTHVWIESLYDPDLDGERRNARGRRWEASAEKAGEADD